MEALQPAECTAFRSQCTLTNLRVPCHTANAATYCLKGIAWFYDAAYSQLSPTVVHLGKACNTRRQRCAARIRCSTPHCSIHRHVHCWPPKAPAPPFPTASGLPTVPSQPVLTSGKTELVVTFNCPTTWNSRFMTFELKRTDLSKNLVVLSSDPAYTSVTPSPRLVSCRSSYAWPGQQAAAFPGSHSHGIP